MTRFLFMRHGETEWNAAGNRYCGVTDVRLNDRGRAQAQDTGRWLADEGASLLFSSPLARAVETAEIVGGYLGAPNRTDSRLREVDFGLWEGLTAPEVMSRHPDNYREWLEGVGRARAGERGETASEVAGRMADWAAETGERYPESTILVVSHSTAIRLFISSTLGMPLHRYRRLVCGNASLCDCRWRGRDNMEWVSLNGHFRSRGVRC